MAKKSLKIKAAKPQKFKQDRDQANKQVVKQYIQKELKYEK